MGLCSFDDNDKVIGIATIGNSRFPMPVLTNSNGAASLNAEVPCLAILTGFPVQVYRLQLHIKLMKHDVGKEWRKNAPLRNTFTGGREQTMVDVACFQDTPEKFNKPLVSDPPPYTFDKQLVMYGIEVACPSISGYRCA